MQIKKIISLMGTVIVSIILFTVLGWFIGVSIGGSFGAPEGGGCVNIKGNMMCDEREKGFVYMGGQGYEGGGLLGIHLGALVGLGIGVNFWNRRNRKLVQ